ncbi:nagb/rpia/CoA transferase-like protein [Lepidopterella palustris CBS 459.81]|uniref:Translation initiation factor eIF2B subunit delta n=1 Tax=Lepidopterella palustris CBS 459.81 TaxID=1314670 RepID=A0A8E2JFH3_9PEZI|nr:nagb/rpia/CoA transferase-like protein [Lepidopterella palustris CBS 459.81]
MDTQSSSATAKTPTGTVPNEPKPPSQQAQGENQKLSGAELKKRAKAEKAARRAQQQAAGGKDIKSPKESKQAPKDRDSKPASKESKQGPKDSEKSKPMPVRRRQSLSIASTKEPKGEVKQYAKQAFGLFGHLSGVPRNHSLVGVSKEVHPAVLALGLQYSSYVICGSTARCVSMLLAFKSVIESYTTPSGTALARNLVSHVLSPNIEFLKSCRAISISQGNAIRWLKDLIVKIDPSVSESEAKSHLLNSIDNFILQRITAADELISLNASQKIQAGDVILTYASSSIVQTTLIKAHKAGTPFRVVVVDSKPLYEGKRLAKTLAKHGLQVSYGLISSASHAIKDATKVFLGASAMLSNGRLYSRVGTAIIAMLADERNIPVIVLCESVKFTERVALDSIVGNEVAPSEELLSEAERDVLVPLKPLNRDPSSDIAADKSDARTWWMGEPLQMLNLMYDVTPSDYIKLVITENGSLPSSSVPVVHRISTNI